MSAAPATISTRSTAPLGWRADRVTLAYPGTSRPAVDSVTLEVPAGACTAIIGPNGAGKSTLLRLLLRSLQLDRGSVHFGGRPLAGWSRAELALAVGVVPQHEQVAFPITVREMVEMGRYPHLGLLRAAGPADRRAVDRAMDTCEVRHLATRRFDTLSGGERQRVRLARALAQEPRALALDEPTLALDVRHEMQIFEMVRLLVGEGVTVVLVTHNLNLAARYANHLALLAEGRLAAAGTPAEVLRLDLLERVYGWPLRLTSHPGPGPDAGAIQVTPLAAANGGVDSNRPQGK